MPAGVRFLPDPANASEPNYDVNAHVDFWLSTAPDETQPRGRGWNAVSRLNAGATARTSSDGTCRARRQSGASQSRSRWPDDSGPTSPRGAQHRGTGAAHSPVWLGGAGLPRGLRQRHGSVRGSWPPAPSRVRDARGARGLAPAPLPPTAHRKRDLVDGQRRRWRRPGGRRGDAVQVDRRTGGAAQTQCPSDGRCLPLAASPRLSPRSWPACCPHCARRRLITFRDSRAHERARAAASDGCSAPSRPCKSS